MATSDYASPAQAKLMRARAHGWRPKNPRKKLPSRAVAEEFVEAKDRKYSGGFAENRYQMGGLIRRLLDENPEFARALRMAQRGERYDPGGTEPTILGAQTTQPLVPARPITGQVAGRAQVGYPAPVGRESPHRARLRAHKTRIEDILRGAPSRVKSPPAPGGPIKEMQMGGLAALMARKTRGAPRQVPLKDFRMRGRPPMGPIRAGGPGGPLPGAGFVAGGPPQGRVSPFRRFNPAQLLGRYGRHRGAPRGGGPSRRGGLFGALQQALMQRQGMMGGRPPGGRGQPGMMGPPGGARIPPNLRGMFQRMQMMNRPRMGPVGGAGNRVGQADQQGALARALQRGTGRPPMSRRYAFPGRR